MYHANFITLQRFFIDFQVTTIQSYSQGINKVLGSLQQKFPSASKSLLKNKVREVSDYVDNRWQVCDGGDPIIY